MDHDLSSEANELRDMVRAFLERKCPESAVRDVVESGAFLDVDTWMLMAGQLGLHGLLVPESLGGQGSSFVEMAVVLEEMGRALLPGPFLSSAVLAVTALLGSGAGSTADELLARLASGEVVAAVAFASGLTQRLDESTVSAAPAGQGWTLHGQVDIVLDGGAADILLVFAPSPAGLGLYAVEAGDVSVTRTPLQTLDLTRSAARVAFEGTPARLLASGADTLQNTLLSVAAVAISAEVAGATQRVLEMAVDYAKLREQFGRPIGSFQAVKHLCTEIFTVAESATAISRSAARVVAENGDLTAAASLAKAYISEECPGAAEKNIQVHGGIGYTWEHPAHLYLRKIKAAEPLFGDAVTHRSRLATHLGLTAPVARRPVAAPSPLPQ